MAPVEVGARLGYFWQEWRNEGADYWVVQQLRRGLSWTFLSPPSLSPTPIPFHVNNPVKLTLIQEHIDKLLLKQAIEPVNPPYGMGFYSLIFLTPKKNGELRPIIDLSALNRSIDCPTFLMESAQSVRDLLSAGQWVASIDLKDAYLHVPIRRSFRKYLRFALEGKVWQFRCLPFGLSIAPWAFTKIMAAVGSMLRLKGVQIHMYLDDWLIRNFSRTSLKNDVHLSMNPVSYTHLTLPTNVQQCRSRWSPYH